MYFYSLSSLDLIIYNIIINFSGNDMSAMAKNMADSDMTPEELSRKTNAIFQAFVDTLIDFPKPICAMVNGPAIGIGVTQEKIRNYFFFR